MDKSRHHAGRIRKIMEKNHTRIDAFRELHLMRADEPHPVVYLLYSVASDSYIPLYLEEKTLVQVVTKHFRPHSPLNTIYFSSKAPFTPHGYYKIQVTDAFSVMLPADAIAKVGGHHPERRIHLKVYGFNDMPDMNTYRCPIRFGVLDDIVTPTEEYRAVPYQEIASTRFVNFEINLAVADAYFDRLYKRCMGKKIPFKSQHYMAVEGWGLQRAAEDLVFNGMAEYQGRVAELLSEDYSDRILGLRRALMESPSPPREPLIVPIKPDNMWTPPANWTPTFNQAIADYAARLVRNDPDRQNE